MLELFDRERSSIYHNLIYLHLNQSELLMNQIGDNKSYKVDEFFLLTGMRSRIFGAQHGICVPSRSRIGRPETQAEPFHGERPNPNWPTE